ncbi:cytoskeletal protein CcmA (bactofilin family) [Pullulanibacillus pueri]|nr:hypothetical protein [Pullulanibacillus pueri]MBM7680353.1 cytoskeletal protein CcmA (bactofilin family) [Pullulanibacillus pueri]
MDVIKRLKMTGSGRSTGGHYSKVRVMGEGNVTGELECDQAKIFGTCTFEKAVKAETFAVFGNAVVRELLTARQIRIYGDADLENTVTRELIIRGNLEIFGTHKGQTVNCKGNLSIKKNCEVDVFHSRGMFSITGLLNADWIDIGLKFGTSQAREIGGETIVIKKDIGLFNGKRDARLIVDSIEGDDISLEATTAKNVRGQKVQIGPDCDIEVVEYQNHLSVSPCAKVARQIKVR